MLTPVGLCVQSWRAVVLLPSLVLAGLGTVGWCGTSESVRATQPARGLKYEDVKHPLTRACLPACLERVHA